MLTFQTGVNHLKENEIGLSWIETQEVYDLISFFKVAFHQSFFFE
jgi:hypothetical protein